MDLNFAIFARCFLDESAPGYEDASKISTIKLKLEEKRRLIEQEKRRMESAWSKQLQTVGKQAFLQAINKVRGRGLYSERFVYVC